MLFRDEFASSKCHGHWTPSGGSQSSLFSTVYLGVRASPRLNVFKALSYFY